MTAHNTVKSAEQAKYDVLTTHSRKCKEPLSADCYVCRRNQQWFDSLPPQLLARVLEDQKPKTLKATLGHFALESWLPRTTDSSKRAAADVAAAKAIFEQFVRLSGTDLVKGDQKHGRKGKNKTH